MTMGSHTGQEEVARRVMELEHGLGERCTMKELERGVVVQGLTLPAARDHYRVSGPLGATRRLVQSLFRCKLNSTHPLDFHGLFQSTVDNWRLTAIRRSVGPRSSAIIWKAI